MYPATAKQTSFISKLAAERGVAVPSVTTSQEASAAIKKLLAAPKAPVSQMYAEAPVEEVGIYRTPSGEVFKVRRSKITKNLYAEKLTQFGGERLTDTGSTVTWKFAYAPGAMRTLTAKMRLTLEDAKKFGLQYGVCIVCGRTLVDAKSVANGIGPVCAKKI